MESESMLKRYEGISSEIKENIGFIFFDNPENENRTGYKETDSLIRAFKDMDTDKDVRVVILSGKGGYFCSGGKIDGFPDGPLVDQREYANIGIQALNTIYGLSKPVIAAVNATALAGGLMFIDACDLAIAGKNCLFGLPEIKRGDRKSVV
jgi:enoyl-CoA hydratase/carnithine racemase